MLGRLPLPREWTCSGCHEQLLPQIDAERNNGQWTHSQNRASFSLKQKRHLGQCHNMEQADWSGPHWPLRQNNHLTTSRTPHWHPPRSPLTEWIQRFRVSTEHRLPLDPINRAVGTLSSERLLRCWNAPISAPRPERPRLPNNWIRRVVRALTQQIARRMS